MLQYVKRCVIVQMQLICLMDEAVLYKKIRDLKNLSPSEETDSLFRQLVSLAEKKDTISLSQQEVEDIQEICSSAESLLEKFYAKRILVADNPKQEITLFPYYENYEALTRLEFENASFCKKSAIQKCLFVGGGSLPLTALLLAQNHDCKVIVLEKEAEPVALSRKIVRALGLEENIEIVHADILSFDDFQNVDCVFLAALVGGTDSEKERIFSYLYEKVTPEALVLLRSSFDGRQMLYKPWQMSFLRKYPLLLEVRPYQHICNSFFIIQKT